MRTKKVGNYASAIIIAILGIVMIILPEMVMDFLCYAMAAVLIVMGIIQLVTYATKDIREAAFGHYFSMGIMLIICGVMFIIKADVIQNLVPLIMGLIIVANGITKLQHAINLKRFKSSSSTFVLIISILCIGIGAILLFAASTVSKIITMIIGVGFLVSGLSDVATYVVMSRKIKEKNMSYDEIMNNVSETVENPQVVVPNVENSTISEGDENSNGTQA